MSPALPCRIYPTALRRLFAGGRVAAMAACGGLAGGAQGAGEADCGGPLFQEAVRQFTAMKSTLYQHHTRVDRAAGSYRYDCVGFVSHALKEAAPQARESAFRTLGIQPGRIPSPPKYRAFFASLGEQARPGWQAVTRAADLRPGDVVAWEKETETSSGHAVVIGGIPVEGLAGVWVVQVYDSTSSPHGTDSRQGDPRAGILKRTGKRSGLGRGLMAFIADPATGVLTGYRWSPKSKTATVPIAAARPVS